MTLPRNPLLIGLMALSLLLAGLFVYEITAPLPESDPPVVHLKPKAQRAAAAMAVTTPSQEAFAEIEMRPMFLPSRKPVATAAEASAAALTPPDIALVGVIVSGQDSLAMLRTPSAPLASAYRVGADISGWKLSEITTERVVLTAGGQRSEIRLDANKPPPAPPRPPGSSQ